MPPFIATLAGSRVITDSLVFIIGPAVVTRSALLNGQPDWVGITGLVGVAGGLLLKWREADITRLKAENKEQRAAIEAQARTIAEQAKVIAHAADERRRLEIRQVDLAAKLAQTDAKAERADAQSQLTEARVEEDRAASGTSPAYAVPPATGPTVLLIEDIAETREYLGLKLTRAGFRVTAAGSFDEGLAAMAAGPDFAVLDLKLPGGRGEDLIRQAAASGIATRIVVVTAKYGDALAEVDALAPHAVLLKSVDVYDELIAALGGGA